MSVMEGMSQSIVYYEIYQVASRQTEQGRRAIEVSGADFGTWHCQEYKIEKNEKLKKLGVECLITFGLWYLLAMSTSFVKLTKGTKKRH